MEYGIGFGDKDWTFNFHESGDGIWYIDFYYQTTEVKYSLPVWRPDMTLDVLWTYHENYEKFADDFCRKEDW